MPISLSKDQRISLRFLLRDKYKYSPIKVADLIQSGDFSSLPNQVKIDINRLLKGEPVSYLIGSVEFLGCHIDLSRKPLIPRPETEYWVGKVIENVNKHQSIKVLDLCCGSGCIGVSILKHISNSSVDFVDIDQDILEQTRLNLRINEISSSRYNLYLSDLFAELPPYSKFDLILANPPYVDEKGFVGPELIYEPPLALFAPDHGLSLIKKIISAAPKYLHHGGRLYSEFGDGQENQLAQFAKEFGIHLEIFPDQFGVNRFFCLTPLSKSL